MRTFLRCLDDQRAMWRSWLLLLLLIVAAPPIVLAMPLVEKQLVDQVLLPRQLDRLPRTILTYGGLWLLSTFCSTAGGLLGTYLREHSTRRLRQRLFAQSQTLSLAFLHRSHSGQAVSLMMNDVSNLANLLTTTVVVGLGSLVAVFVGVVLALSLSWQLALVAGLTPPLVAGMATLITRPMRGASRRAQEKAAEVTVRLQESLAGLREIVAFGKEEVQRRQFATALTELLGLRMRIAAMDTGVQAGQSAFSLVASLAILGYGGYLVIQGHITLGTVIAMRSIFGSLFGPAGQLFGLASSTQKALGSADRIYAFLDEAPLVQERAGARPPRDIVGAITFDRVSFAYQPGQPVLQDICFTAHQSQTVALVGPSGAGKSTLVSLIPRFYDPGEGRILLDGIDLRDLTLAGLRNQIAIVFQDTFLFAATIRENIAFGCPSADESQIIAAARAANAWEFIARLPRGLDTLVGERGVHLSEGQKQRVAIARALLRDPKILILDEPTSSLDARSDHLLQSALETLMSGRTTFVIAHRLATVQRADQILVLDHGRIVERGTHAELVRHAGLYSELYALQFSDRVSRRDTLMTATTSTEGPAELRIRPAMVGSEGMLGR